MHLDGEKHRFHLGSTGPTIDQLTASQLISSGFRIVGDVLDEAPEGMISAHRNGGSLEKGVADTALFESVDEDSLLSIYWRARIDDLRVREDKDAISWLEKQTFGTQLGASGICTNHLQKIPLFQLLAQRYIHFQRIVMVHGLCLVRR